MSNPLRAIRDHAQALLKALRGKPEARHAEGIVKALERIGDANAKPRA